MYLLEVCSSAGSPSYCRASAALNVQVLDQGNQRLWSACWRSISHPFASAFGRCPGRAYAPCKKWQMPLVSGRGNEEHYSGLVWEVFAWDSIRPIDGGVETAVASTLSRRPCAHRRTRPPCVAARTSGDPQRKMQDQQGRDAASVPVMPEVTVHRDGGLWRPVLWKGRRGLTEMQAAETSRNDVLTVFFEGSSATPPPPDIRRITPYRRRYPSHQTGSASLPSPHRRRIAVPRPLAVSLLPWPLCAYGKESGSQVKSGYQVSSWRYRSRFLRSVPALPLRVTR